MQYHAGDLRQSFQLVTEIRREDVLVECMLEMSRSTHSLLLLSEAKSPVTTQSLCTFTYRPRSTARSLPTHDPIAPSGAKLNHTHTYTHKRPMGRTKVLGDVNVNVQFVTVAASMAVGSSLVEYTFRVEL